MRIEGWEQLLDEYLQRSNKFTLVWGKTDCALWVGEWVRLCTGEDYTAPYLGKYVTETGAARALKKNGFASLAELMDAHLLPITLPMAMRGDVVMGKEGNAGIAHGARAFFLPRDGAGLIVTRLDECDRAWRV